MTKRKEKMERTSYSSRWLVRGKKPVSLRSRIGRRENRTLKIWDAVRLQIMIFA